MGQKSAVAGVAFASPNLARSFRQPTVLTTENEGSRPQINFSFHTLE